MGIFVLVAKTRPRRNGGQWGYKFEIFLKNYTAWRSNYVCVPGARRWSPQSAYLKDTRAFSPSLGLAIHSKSIM